MALRNLRPRPTHPGVAGFEAGRVRARAGRGDIDGVVERGGIPRVADAARDANRRSRRHTARAHPTPRHDAVRPAQRTRVAADGDHDGRTARLVRGPRPPREAVAAAVRLLPDVDDRARGINPPDAPALRR